MSALPVIAKGDCVDGVAGFVFTANGFGVAAFGFGVAAFGLGVGALAAVLVAALTARRDRKLMVTSSTL
jgi:hypothetical protein